MGRLYNKAFEYRQKFDYVDFAVADKDMVIEYVEKAEQFVTDIDAYLKSWFFMPPNAAVIENKTNKNPLAPLRFRNKTV